MSHALCGHLLSTANNHYVLCGLVVPVFSGSPCMFTPRTQGIVQKLLVGSVETLTQIALKSLELNYFKEEFLSSQKLQRKQTLVSCLLSRPLLYSVLKYSCCNKQMTQCSPAMGHFMSFHGMGNTQESPQTAL